MNIIKGRKLSYDYFRVDEDGKEEEAVRAVDRVDLDVKEGDFVAILGHNGSGKSTLAKHINAILLPTEGTLYVDGKDTKDESKLWEIRQSAGMVFQNPDNQIIGTIVDAGCRVWTGKYGGADEGNLGACGKESEGSRNVGIPFSFSE